MHKVPLTADTKDNIVNLAQEFIQTRGYNAFSYQDISDRLEIKKASVHHHFASKDDLGAEVFEQARLRFEEWTKELSSKLSAPEKLDAFIMRIGFWSKTRDRICLSGIMNAEWNTLPKKMKQKAEAFQVSNKIWLVKILEEGRKSGAFNKSSSAEMQALLIMSTAQGALQLCRVQDNPALFGKLMDQIKATITT